MGRPTRAPRSRACATDPPRERLERLGPAALNDGELLALLMRTGVAGSDAVTVANALLDRHGGLRGIAGVGAGELAAQPGVGPAKSAAVCAALLLYSLLPKGTSDEDAIERRLESDDSGSKKKKAAAALNKKATPHMMDALKKAAPKIAMPMGEQARAHA